MTQVKIHMNSMRRSLLAEMADLRSELQYQGLDCASVDAFNLVASSINAFMSVHIDGVEEFDDISNIVPDIAMLEG